LLCFAWWVFFSRCVLKVKFQPMEHDDEDEEYVKSVKNKESTIGTNNSCFPNRHEPELFVQGMKRGTRIVGNITETY
jgi:hypothetical protein